MTRQKMLAVMPDYTWRLRWFCIGDTKDGVAQCLALLDARGRFIAIEAYPITEEISWQLFLHRHIDDGGVPGSVILDRSLHDRDDHHYYDPSSYRVLVRPEWSVDRNDRNRHLQYLQDKLRFLESLRSLYEWLHDYWTDTPDFSALNPAIESWRCAYGSFWTKRRGRPATESHQMNHAQPSKRTANSGREGSRRDSPRIKQKETT